MRVEELIKELQKEDPKSLVVMAKDGEGNDHSPLSSYWCGVYRAETTWNGEVGYDKLTKELKEAGYTEEDIIEGEPAVILCPIN